MVPSWIGTRAYDVDGARLGVVADLLFDETTRRPEWAVLELLRASDRFVLVPVTGARQHPRGVVLPVHRRVVRTAPTSAAPPDGLAAAHARALARHYGLACGPGPWRGVAEPAVARGLEGQRVRLHVSRAA